MPLVAGDQVVGTGGVGALQKLIVVGILRDVEHARRVHELRMILYELKKLLAKASADFKFTACHDFPVFRENGWGDVEAGGFRHRKHEHSALEAVRFQCRRDEDICVNNEPERNHRRFGFRARTALIT